MFIQLLLSVEQKLHASIYSIPVYTLGAPCDMGELGVVYKLQNYMKICTFSKYGVYQQNLKPQFKQDKISKF